MRVLVSAGSKYGATEEIAQAIGDALRRHGQDAEVVAPEHVESLEGFDAAVLGSAVYAGHWQDDVKALVEGQRNGWPGLQVWLFSSGPLGDPPKPDEEPVDVAPILEATGAREHRVFAGKLDRGNLNFFEKALCTALRAPQGDFRDWDDIRTWAGSIADDLGRER